MAKPRVFKDQLGWSVLFPARPREGFVCVGAQVSGFPTWREAFDQALKGPPDLGLPYRRGETVGFVRAPKSN